MARVIRQLKDIVKRVPILGPTIKDLRDLRRFLLSLAFSALVCSERSKT